jgi:hypothetical protein
LTRALDRDDHADQLGGLPVRVRRQSVISFGQQPRVTAAYEAMSDIRVRRFAYDYIARSKLIYIGNADNNSVARREDGPHTGCRHGEAERFAGAQVI